MFKLDYEHITEKGVPSMNIPDHKMVDSFVKIIPEYSNKYSCDRGIVQSFTFVGQIPHAGVLLDNGSFKWIPRVALMAVDAPSLSPAQKEEE